MFNIRICWCDLYKSIVIDSTVIDVILREEHGVKFNFFVLEIDGFVIDKYNIPHMYFVLMDGDGNVHCELKCL